MLYVNKSKRWKEKLEYALHRRLLVLCILVGCAQLCSTTCLHAGEIILRIEDTDSNRFVPGAEDYINEAFAWLGIKFDEGVREGGNFGPYRQSERRDIYRTYVKQLLDNGKAYIAFDTPEELEAKRSEIANSNTMQKLVAECATR